MLVFWVLIKPPEKRDQLTGYCQKIYQGEKAL